MMWKNTSSICADAKDRHPVREKVGNSSSGWKPGRWPRSTSPHCGASIPAACDQRGPPNGILNDRSRVDRTMWSATSGWRGRIIPTALIGCGPELCVPQTQPPACKRQACHLPHPLRYWDVHQLLEQLSDSSVVLHSKLETQGKVDQSKHVIGPRHCAEEEQKPHTLKV